MDFYYRHTLEELGKRSGMLGVIFRKAQNNIQGPAKLRRLIVDLIDKEQRSCLSPDVKGDACEGLLQKNIEDVKGGAGLRLTEQAPKLRKPRAHLMGKREMKILLGNREEMVNDLIGEYVQQVFAEQANIKCARVSSLDEFLDQGCARLHGPKPFLAPSAGARRAPQRNPPSQGSVFTSTSRST